MPKKKKRVAGNHERPEPQALTDEITRQVAKMQTPNSKEGVRSLFSATPEELGMTAVEAARRKRVEAQFYAAGLAGRAELLAQEGGCVDAPEAARRMGIEVSEVEANVTKNALIGIRVSDGTVWLPAWQLDRAGCVLQGIPAALQILAQSPGFSSISPFLFFLSPNARLSGLRPLDAVRSGNSGDVIAAAEIELD